MATGRRPDAVGVLDRVTAVLDAFDDDAEELAIAEIADRSGLPTSTVSRMVADLVREGYLERDDRVLRLGLRLFELGQLAEPARSLRAAALPAMAELRAGTGGTVQLAVLDGAEVVRLAVLAGQGGMATLRVGGRMPVAASVMGGVLLTASSLRAGAGVVAGAGAVRRAGFEVGYDEPVRGEATVAAGAPAPGSAVVVALGLSVAVGDLHLERAGAAVRAAVQSLAGRLGPALADE